MTNLVTDAAVDAVMRWLPDFVVYTDGGLERARYTTRRNLETAAPHIAAEALRQAAGRFDNMDKESFDPWYWSDLSDELRKWADGLEGK